MKKNWLTLTLGIIVAFHLAACTRSATQPENPNQPEDPSSNPEITGAQTEQIITHQIEIPIPTEYLPLLTIETDGEEGDTNHYQTILTVSETKSIEEGQKDHPGEDWGDGWLFSIAELDQVGFERYLSFDEIGFQIFANAEETNRYYMIETPTDVRIFRETEADYTDEDIQEWGLLNEWVLEVPDAIIENNSDLDALDTRVYFSGFTYEGEHRFALYQEPDADGGSTLITLSQPTGAGDGSIWCVERIQYSFTETAYDEPYTRLNFPVAMGYDMTAEAYYAQLQEQCNAGEHPEMLTPEGALDAFIHSEAWLFSSTDINDFEFVTPEG